MHLTSIVYHFSMLHIITNVFIQNTQNMPNCDISNVQHSGFFHSGFDLLGLLCLYTLSFHFLFHCNLYHQQRQTFYTFVNSINRQFTNLDVPTKFDLIMNNPNVIKRTAQFIVTCYDVRCKQHLNEMDFNVNNGIQTILAGWPNTI